LLVKKRSATPPVEESLSAKESCRGVSSMNLVGCFVKVIY